MSNEVTQAKSFQERVFDEIKGKIGDLMTPEEIKKLVDRAMDEAFFKKEEVIDRWGHRVESLKDPPIYKLIKDLTQPAITEAVKQWLEAHPEKFEEALANTIGLGMMKFFQSWMSATAIDSTQAFANHLRGVLQSKGIQI